MFDSGTVFKLSKSGSNYSIVRIFGGASGEAVQPNSLVISGGSLYGTTERGGVYDGGTVFRMNLDGTSYGLLWEFGANESDGLLPNGVLAASDGRLYGTTSSGGNAGAGTVFALSKGGTGRTVLRHFGAAVDGAVPQANVIEGADGRLYGTTFEGGAWTFGTVFRMNKDGSGYSILVHFGADSTDARFPLGALALDETGTLFGTTQSGGLHDAGTVFRVGTLGANYAVLRSFSTVELDARYVRSGLVLGANGLLYGTSPAGGAFEFGTAFRLAKDGSDFAIIHSFSGGGRDNADPGTLLRTAEGLFGTTSFGGALGAGQIFRISNSSIPVAPLLALQMSSGMVTLTITGQLGDRYLIEASSSLSPPWQDLGTVTNLTGVVSLQTPSGISPNRFYRATALAP